METALLLVEPADVSTAGRLEKVLAIFGVPARRLTVPEFLASIGTANGGSKSRLLASAATFLKLVEALEKDSNAGSTWQKNVHSAFVLSEKETVSLTQLARHLTGDAKASLAKVSQGAEWIVTNESAEFCKSMSGVQVSATNGADSALVFDETKTGAKKLITTQAGAALVRLEFQTVPIFLSTAGIIDVEAQLPARVFDIRTHFLTATPTVLYVKWAFAETCWQPPETGACLVIDDPLLKPRYGYLKYQQLLKLMERVNF